MEPKTAVTCDKMALIEGLLVGCVIVGEEVVLRVRGSRNLPPVMDVDSTNLCLLIVHILFNRRRTVLRALLGLFMACTLATLVGMYFAAVGLKYNDLCLIASGTYAMLLVWCVHSARGGPSGILTDPGRRKAHRLTPMAFETVLFAMTMWKV